ncbi:MAG: YqaJ-like viral recombinase domain protein [Alphaproteobacteria bacterium ADurb.Bin438]|nr:MAG: YqaJ-like viral recombinase domain protein [Alphaproteobacteria bacterium ADurb.Bin438]
MIIHNFEQGTDEWFAVRLGKFTASQAHTIGVGGKGLETLVKEKACEILTGKTKDYFKSEAMEQGNELEHEARQMFEFMTGLTVEQVGFYELDKYTGVSPDGLTSDDGLIEIKCPQGKTFLDYMLDGKVDTKYMWQMQMQMMITEKNHCYYVVYNPDFENPIIIKKIDRDEDKIEKIKSGLESGIKQLEEILDKVKGK